MSKRATLRLFLLNCLAVGLSLTAGFVLAELATRIFSPQQLIIARPDIYVAADSLGWKHRPFVNTTVNTGERTVAFVTDSSGFRISRALRRPTSRHVLMIGDSFMAAMQVEYEQSLAGLLDDTLFKLHTHASIDNSAVDGWDPPQYLIQLRRSLNTRPYAAVIVCTYLGNDVVPTTRRYVAPLRPAEVHAFRWPRTIRRREFVEALLYPVNDVLERRSHFYILVKNRLRAARMRMGLTGESLPGELLRRDSAAGRWDSTRTMFEEMAGVARSHGVPITFILIPSSYQVDSAELRTFLMGFGINSAEIDVEQPNRLMSARLAASGIKFADPLEQLRAASSAGLKPYGSVDAHFSPEGHKVLAALVLPQLLEMLSADRCRTTDRRDDCR